MSDAGDLAAADDIGSGAEDTGAADARAARRQARRRWLAILGLVVLVALLLYAVWTLFIASPNQSTDDAYVAGDVISITARDAGTAITLYADDTERVLAGQPLIDLDPASADVELAAAAARLGEAVRNVRSGFSAVDIGKADVANAEAQLAHAEADLKRRRQAAGKGAVSGEELTHASDAVTLATTQLNAARGRLQQAEADVQGTGIRDNPAVLAAIAAYHQAAIRRSHMHIVSPVDGTVAKRNVQIGQHVAAGTPLMAIVPLERVWIDANFRETQLADIRVGQPVRITTDLYGSQQVFNGHVVGLSAGSGDAFALLPAQNATGNWIKIVQRLPVRIALDTRQLKEHPLRIGLSTTVRIDTSDRSGSPLGREAAPQPLAAQGSLDPDVEAEVDRIIRMNAGRRP